MSGLAMAGPLSPLRWRLCSQEHAARVAGRLQAAGEEAAVARGSGRLQPWRVVEGAPSGSGEDARCV